MRKEKWISIVTAFSLLLTSLLIWDGQAALADASGIHTLQRVISGQNDGLQRYKYTDGDGREITLPSAGNTASRKRASALPSSYDSRNAGAATPIKNQGTTGGCWAFGALKALESSSIRKGISALEDTDYSENHLIWYTYHTLTDSSHPLYGDYMSAGDNSNGNVYDYGGNALMASFTLANGWGAVREEAAPFTAGNAQETEEMAALMRNADESLRFQSDIRLTEANCYDNASRDEIKQAVIDYGSLDVAFYYGASGQYTGNGISSYYQNRYTADDANHCAAIVGWDDDFNAFKRSPPKSGAWLIANSYGESSGMDGYFWLSYYDTSLCEFFSLEGDVADTHDSSFQYDGFGWNEGYWSDEDIALANIFTNGEDSPRQIDAVSFYTLADCQKYKIQVYRNVKENGPTDGEPVSKCTVTGTAQRGGYHTVSLDEPFSVAPGERFSVVVTFQPGDGTDGIAYALMEGASDPASSLYYNSSPGQSYVYFASDNIWYDNTAFENPDQPGKIENNNNVCIKAFGNTITEEEFQEQEKKYIPETPAPTDTPSPTAAAETDWPPALPGTTASSLPGGSTLPGGSSIPAPGGNSSTGNPASPTDPSAQPASTGGSQPGRSKITLSKSKLVIGKGESVTIPVTVSPASVKKQLEYSSSNENIAVVNKNGRVAGMKKGKSVITITEPGGTKKTVSVIVKKMPASIRFTNAKSNLKRGKTFKLKTTLSKGSASYQLTYRSTNPKVISVNKKGKLRARKKGTAWITVRTYNKKTARIKIKSS